MAATTAPRRDPNYRWLPASAGVAMEPGEIARWRARLGPGWEVIPRTRFSSRYGLAGAFRGASRPDMVAVHHRGRRVLVGDVTSRPDPDHLAKTVGYAQRLAARLDPSLQGYRVLAQDWYWALPPEYGRRPWPTSRRILVPVPVAGQRERELLPELAEEYAPRPRAVRAISARPLRFRVVGGVLNTTAARQALWRGHGVFLVGANKGQARQWLLSALPGADPRTLAHDAGHGPTGRPHWHVERGGDRTAHVFYGQAAPRRSFFVLP